MCKLLFLQIPSFLFEPIAVTFLAGVILFFASFRQERNDFTAVFALFLLITLGWRIYYSEIIISSRYSSVLIYPAVIFTAFFGLKSEAIATGIWTKISHSENPNPIVKKYCSYLPFLLFGGLCVASLAKTFHYNPYHDYQIKMCQALLQDTLNRENVSVYTTENKLVTRSSYYLKQMNADVKIQLISRSESSLKRFQLRYHLAQYKNTHGTYYYSIVRKENEPEYTAASLGIENGEWSKIFQMYMSRNKHKEILLYRYTPRCPDVHIWTGPIDPLRKDNCIRNGDFEQRMQSEKNQKSIKVLAEKGVTFYEKNQLSFPAGWWINTDKYDASEPPYIYLSSRKPLGGKYSLILDSLHTQRAARIISNNVPHGKYVFSGFIRNEVDSPALIYVRVHSRNRVSKNIMDMATVSFYSYPDEICRFESKCDLSGLQKDNDAYLSIESFGCISLDNVELLPDRK